MKLRTSIAAVAAVSVMLTPGVALASGNNVNLGTIPMPDTSAGAQAITLDPDVAVANLAIANTMDLVYLEGIETKNQNKVTATMENGDKAGFVLDQHAAIKITNGFSAGVIQTDRTFSPTESTRERSSFGYTDKRGQYASWNATDMSERYLLPVDKKAVKRVGKADYVTQLPESWMFTQDYKAYVTSSMETVSNYLRFATLQSSSKTSDGAIDGPSRTVVLRTACRARPGPGMVEGGLGHE